MRFSGGQRDKSLGFFSEKDDGFVRVLWGEASMRVLVSITGASGSIYGVRLVEELVRARHEVFLIISETARPVLEFETKYYGEAG